jgi:hypothetical protein
MHLGLHTKLKIFSQLFLFLLVIFYTYFNIIPIIHILL